MPVKSFLVIQDEMIKKVGIKAVELITSTINCQTVTLDSLTKQKCQKTINEFTNGADKKRIEENGDS